MKRAFACLIGCFLCMSALPTSAQTVSGSAKSAVLYEPNSGYVLYQKDAHTVRPMASTTKLMTALLLAERFPPEHIVTVSDAALPAEGSSMGLRVGDTLTVRDLLAGMLLASGNDAANVAAIAVSGSLSDFAVLMNQKAVQLGMCNTLFVTPSGLDEGGHGSTAYDMALLGAAVLQHPLLKQLCATKSTTATVSEKTVWLQNHNKLLSLYPHTVGLKTGFTEKAGRCLVSAAEKDGRLLIAVTLSAPDDWNDHIALFNDGFDRMCRQKVSQQELPDIPLIGAVCDTVRLCAEMPDQVTLFDGEQLTVQSRLPARLFAPLKAGQQVGEIYLMAGNRQIARIAVTVETAVLQRAKPTLWHSIAKMFLQLLQDWMTI